MKTVDALIAFTGIVFTTILSSTNTAVISTIGSNATFNLNIPNSVVSHKKFTVAYERAYLLFDVSVGAPPTVRRYENIFRDRVSNIKYHEGEIDFILHNVTETDAGNYICLDVRRDVIQGCGDILIIIQYPTQPKIRKHGVTVKGKALHLSCFSSSRSLPDNHNLSTIYHWKRNDNEISNSLRIDVNVSRVLTLRDLRLNDTGEKFSCQAEEVLGLKSDWSTSFMVDVEYGPEEIMFDPSEEVLSVDEGSDINVRCFADCNPNCAVVWWDRERRVEIGRGQKECTLIITAAYRNASKQFQCNTINEHGNISRNLIIHMKYFPSVTGFSANNEKRLTVNIGDAVSFICVVSSNTLPDAFLMFDGIKGITPYALHRVTLRNFTNTINSIQPSNHGKYFCQGSNEVGMSKSNYIYLNVKCAPTPDDQHPDTLKLEVPASQKEVQIIFHVFAFPVPNSGVWYFANQDMQYVEIQDHEKYRINQTTVKGNLHHYTLDITSFSQRDFGTYMLEIANTEGNSTFIAVVSRNDTEERDKDNPEDEVSMSVVVVVPIVVIVTAGAVLGVINVMRRKKRNRNAPKPENEYVDSFIPIAERWQTRPESYIHPTYQEHDYITID